MQYCCASCGAKTARSYRPVFALCQEGCPGDLVGYPLYVPMVHWATHGARWARCRNAHLSPFARQVRVPNRHYGYDTINKRTRDQNTEEEDRTEIRVSGDRHLQQTR
eukprot:symbB.v1.2.035841.t1/scaffold4920.1/size32872/3